MARDRHDPAHAGVEAVVARSRHTRHDRLRARAARRLRVVVLAVVPLVAAADVVVTLALG